MIKYKVSCDLLYIREEPTTKSRIIGFYEFGEFINTGGKPFKGEDGNLWIRYIGGKTGLPRYVCYQYEIEEKYLILISSQNNLGNKENEINKINFKNNCLKEDNSEKEKETEENNKLINSSDIKNLNNLEEIFDLKNNILFFPLYKENEIELNGFNSISICQNQQNHIIIQNEEKNNIMPKCWNSQGSHQINYCYNAFLHKEHDSFTLNSQDKKNLYLLPQDKNSLNSKVKRENDIKLMFKTYKFKARPTHTKFAFDNMMKTVKSSSIDIIINILNIKVNEIIKLKEIEQINFLKIKLDTKNPTKKYYLDLLQRTFRQIIGSNVTNKYKNKDNHNKEIIEKIYKIYEKGNYQKGIKDLVDFLNMKYIDFWDGLQNHMNQADKKIISVNENKDNNIFLASLIKGFIPKVDEFLNKKEEDENYKTEFKKLLGNVPLRINNMKGESKKKYD